MELRVRVKDIQWGALVLFVLYTVVVVCFLFNEMERHAEDDIYARGQMKLVWNSKNRADFFLSHDDYGNEWFQKEQADWPLWMQTFGQQMARNTTLKRNKYFLSAFLAPQTEFDNRDLMDLKRDVASLKQWIHYMLLAGVDHIYLCDCHQQEENHLQKHMWRFVAYGVLTYIPMHINDSIGFRLQDAQAKCFKDHVAADVKKDTDWLMPVNILEYPYVYNDQREGFLSRHLRNLITASGPGGQGDSYTDVQTNYMQVSGPGDGSKTLVLERGKQMYINPELEVVAPLYRPSSRVDVPNPEHLEEGQEVDPDSFINQNTNSIKSADLVMINFQSTVKLWSKREQLVASYDIPANLSKVLAPLVRKSMEIFGEKDAYLGVG